MGTFANDPDEGEILYMYTTDPNPDYIPDKNSALVISASYALNIAVLNVDNIVVNIDPEGLITVEILKEKLKKYLPLSGGIMEGLVSLFTGSTVPTPAENDNSEQITNTEWVQTWVKAFVSKLSENIEVETQEDGHFSCPALGITGLMAQNGYICLGKLFGNLILQWGKVVIGHNNFPISFIENVLATVCTDSGNSSISYGISTNGLESYTAYANIEGNYWAYGVFIGV